MDWYHEIKRLSREMVERWEAPEWNQPDEDDKEWLYSSERAYTEQIRHYRRVRG